MQMLAGWTCWNFLNNAGGQSAEPEGEGRGKVKEAGWMEKEVGLKWLLSIHHRAA